MVQGIGQSLYRNRRSVPGTQGHAWQTLRITRSAISHGPLHGTPFGNDVGNARDSVACNQSCWILGSHKSVCQLLESVASELDFCTERLPCLS